MADKSLCKIKGCGKPCLARGWCREHYYKWSRNGDPMFVRRGHAARFLEDIVLSYNGENCLIWPYNTTSEGYGLINYKGKMQSVHRLVCILVNGGPPTSRHYAAHECGNGSIGCVNPNHLSWKTPTENKADELRHGTRVRGEEHSRAKLTESDVRKIRSLRGVISQQEIADIYGVGQAHISEIQRRVRWAWLE